MTCLQSLIPLISLILKKTLEYSMTKIHIDLVVVSPLRRTLQTATSIFPSFYHIISFSFREIFSSRKYDNIPFIANELCRESYGVVVCDKRRNLIEIKEEYPRRVNFSLIETEEDTWWTVEREDRKYKGRARVENSTE